MSITIAQERPDSPDAAQLIAELDAVLAPHYPVQSRHGYSIDKLLREGVAFFIARVDGTPAACGGVLLIPGEYAEVKRMYVRPSYRGGGLGRLMLEHLIWYAQENAMQTLRLETGIFQTEAIGLYEKIGFQRIPPFGPYTSDPVSVCFEKKLSLP
ncbi:MAG: GNAT family N-acetyltransferase [Pleurocapsa minor GSE-CHR-MK-17-07R]|jgi:GNAT superfamily N-acetyltransferase|nr:GNAT family N-acetyltransferase [Pleurocapsa minor GSE-CHR-MK 17-07R]